MDEITYSQLTGAFCAVDEEKCPKKCADNLLRRLGVLYNNFTEISIDEFKVLTVYDRNSHRKYNINLDMSNFDEKKFNSYNLYNTRDYIFDRYDNDGLEKCLCGKLIIYIYIIEIKFLNIRVQIGSSCVNQFNTKLGLALNKIQSVISNQKNRWQTNYNKVSIMLNNLFKHKEKIKKEYRKVENHVKKNYKKCLDCDIMILKKENYIIRCVKCYFWLKNNEKYRKQIEIDDEILKKYYEFKNGLNRYLIL